VLEEEPQASEQGDPVVAAFLAFLEKDLKTRPGCTTALSKASIARATRLVKGVKVSDRDRLPDDVG